MKKSILYSTMLLSVIALAACSSPSTTNGTKKNSSSSTSKATSTTNKTDSLEVKNGPLTKVGQWRQTEDLGKITLLKIMDKPKTITLTEGLTTTIESVKLFHADNITKFNTPLFRTDKKSGNYIQIVASAENNTDNEYRGIFPETIVLSDGTQVEHNRSFQTSIDVKPHAKNKEMLYFYFLDKQTPDSLRLYYSSLYDQNGIGINDIKAETEILFE
jgi:hypothetical protein